VEKKLAVGELDGVGFVTKKICRIHKQAFGSANAGYKANTASSKLQLRDSRISAIALMRLKNPTRASKAPLLSPLAFFEDLIK
jgi:hypothetical protein